MNKKLKFVNAELSNDTATNDRTFRFCFSDGTVDAMGDTLNPKGWNLDDFERNPVALYNHNSSTVIGRASNLAVEGNRLMGDIEFAPAEVSPFADEICKMVAHGYIKAVSVGFLPVEYRFNKEPDRHIDYKSQKLLEISVCAIPCNPNALIEMDSKGIDTSWFIDDFLPDSKTLINTSPENEENTLMALTTVLKSARRELAKLEKANRFVTKDDGDNDDDDKRDNNGEHEMHLRSAHAHLKAMEDLYAAADEHHEEAMKCIRRCFSKAEETSDDGDKKPEDKPEDSEEQKDDDEETEKMIARIRARGRARAAKE